ncbi:endonuclease/exonuclease/phosphatase family protein [Stieleria sp. TO1_6]|uniref:endonuclease/exonuclease/phosphatase family protein n=1 Tax=Stieleria tagensis TaxID=2956795 RepID=UPI00209B8D9B|nr:endonuclease/exonuclease/phosphatase family protein [Stieleria tagensis]MCO8120109.1 endonuclease/exonuclease/phosphatase family protein [Stieleria tagensis]
MARKKSRSPMFTWVFVTLLSSSGLGGYLNPDWPLIGPIVQQVLAVGKGSGSAATGPDGQPAAGANVGPGAIGGLSDRITSQLQSRYGSTDAKLASAPLNTASPGASNRPAGSLLIASYNIQVLGQSKMSKPDVVNVLAHVIRQFDIVAIQEVRAKDDNVIPDLVAAVNANGGQYNYLVGPRLGRTVSTEQYAFVFDTSRVEYDPSAVGTISDPTDLLHREPYAARFRARTNSPQHAFTFWMVNTHTDPDEVPEEVAALADVFKIMQTARADEDDVILLGDLNASESQLGPLGQVPGISWAVHGVMTNTRQTKAYDNILFHAQSTAEFTGRWGVYDLQRILGLSADDALKVSDHYPVWAEFQIWEAPKTNQFSGRFQGN